MKIVDVLGLSPAALKLQDKGSHADLPVRYARAVAGDLDGDCEIVTDPNDRQQWLYKLRRGAGVTIVTGPKGAPFWSLVSPEVTILVEPDGYVYKDRYDEMVWALVVRCGMTPTAAKQLCNKPPKTNRSVRWQMALELAKLVQEGTAATAAVVIEEFPSTVLSVDEGIRLLGNLASTNAALDWEWDPRSPDNHPYGLAVSTANMNYYIVVRAADVEEEPGSADKLRRAFAEHIALGTSRVIMHNGRADIGTQIRDPLRALRGESVDDTLIVAYLLGEGGDLGLKALSHKHLGRNPVEFYDISGVTAQQVARYAAAGDTRNTYDLWRELYPRLIRAGLAEVYHQIERPLVPVVAQMEQTGSPVALDRVRRMQEHYSQEEQELLDYGASRYGYWIEKDATQRALVKEYTGYDPGSVSAEILSEIPGDHVDLILAYRQTRTLRRTFLDKILQAGQNVDGPLLWLHPNFNQAGSSADGLSFKRAPRTGRFSSSEPNFQNQPRKIREVFVAPEGCVYWSIDEAQLELRIAAALSRDPTMLETILSGGDLHAVFQQRIFELTGVMPERTVVKNGNFEQLYGGGAQKLINICARNRIFLSPEVADMVVSSHKVTFPYFHRWSAEMVALTRQLGYAETYWKRKRWLAEELNSPDPTVVGNAERAAVNTCIQGSAADLIKIYMREAVPILQKYGAHMSVQVHDELCGWVPRENADRFLNAMKMMMDGYTINGVPLKAEGSYGDSWLAAKA